jgi:hypothetical protein
MQGSILSIPCGLSAARQRKVLTAPACRLFVAAMLAVSTTLVFMANPVAAQGQPAHSRGLVVATFDPTDENIINPERGFSRFENHTVSQNALHNRRQQGHSVVGLMITMSAFREAPISDAFLGQIQTAFNRARTAGIKLIPRFRYDSTAAGRDAPLELVLVHIEQVAPLLQANKDVIMAVEAGFIGAWGEWHGSVNNLTDTGAGFFGNEVNASTRAIVAALLEALPGDRMIAVRTPRYKWQLIGDVDNLTLEEAFSGSDRARIGFHNDCFLASETDFGTYASGQRQAELDWLHEETHYLPHVGETCSTGEAALPYIACENAIYEMDYNHWTSLNLSWHPDVYAFWQANGCMDEIRRRLGYRFVLKSAKAPVSVPAGGSLRLHLEISNPGFASPFNERPVEAVLRHVDSGEVHLLPLDADPRRWWSGETRNYPLRVDLPGEVVSGEYEVLVNLPDASLSLRNDPRYSIRFANEGTWEANTGYNNLGLRVIVTP